MGRFAKIKEIHLLLSALLVLSALSYFLVFSPKVHEVRRIEAEVAAANADMETSLKAWGGMSRASRRGLRPLLAAEVAVSPPPPKDRPPR